MNSTLTLILSLSNCCSSDDTEGFDAKELAYSLDDIVYLLG